MAMSDPVVQIGPSMDELESVADDFFETRRYAPADAFEVDSDGLPIVDESVPADSTDTNTPA